MLYVQEKSEYVAPLGNSTFQRIDFADWMVRVNILK